MTDLSTLPVPPNCPYLKEENGVKYWFAMRCVVSGPRVYCGETWLFLHALDDFERVKCCAIAAEFWEREADRLRSAPVGLFPRTDNGIEAAEIIVERAGRAISAAVRWRLAGRERKGDA